MSYFPDDPRQLVQKRFRYFGRAHFRGKLSWICPRCGRMNQHSLTPHVWSVNCRDPRCHQTFILGIRFGVPKGNCGPEPHISPGYEDVFPGCELFPWRSGEPADSLVVAMERS